MAKKNTTSLTEWIYLLFWAVLPFVKVESLIDHTMVPRQLFIALVLLGLIATSWKTLFGKTLRASLPVLCYFGFLLLSIFTSFVAINPIESYATLARYGLAFSFFMVTVDMIKSQKLAMDVFIKGVGIFAAISALFAAVELLKSAGQNKFFEDIYVVKGFFSHKNLLSSALMLSLPFLAIGYHRFKGWMKTANLALIFVIVAEIFILRTRGVWLSMFVAAAATLATYYTIRKKEIEGLKLPVKLIGAGVGLAGIILVALFSVSEVQTSVTDQTNLGTRQKFWKNSYKMIKDQPLTGVGAGNWKVNFPKYNLKNLDDNVMQGITHIQRPHDDYLWVLSEGGILSFLLYIGIFVFGFLLVRNNLKTAQDLDEIVLNLAIVFGITAYLTFSMTDFPMERMSHNALILGLLAFAHYKDSEGKLSIKGNYVKIGVLAICLIGLGITSQRWKGEKGATEVLKYNTQRNAQRIIPAVEDAENGFYNMDNYANPLRYYSAMGKLVSKNLNGALEDIEMAEEIHPNNILVLNLKGNVLKAQGKDQQALKYYQKATHISPRFEQALLNKAEIYLKRKKYKKALRNLSKVLPNSQNPKYRGLLKPTLAGFMQEDRGYFKNLRQHILNGNPRTQDDYLSLYFDYFKTRSKPKLERKAQKIKEAQS